VSMALSSQVHGVKLENALCDMLDKIEKSNSSTRDRDLLILRECRSTLRGINQLASHYANHSEYVGESNDHLWGERSKTEYLTEKEDHLDDIFGAHVLISTDTSRDDEMGPHRLDIIVSYETAKHLLHPKEGPPMWLRCARIRREAWSMIRGIGAGLEKNEFVEKWQPGVPCALPTPWTTWGIIQDGVCSIDCLDTEELEKRTHPQVFIEFPDGLYRKIVPSNDKIGLLERILKEPISRNGENEPIEFGMYILIIGQAAPVSVEDLLARRVPPLVNWFALRSPFFRLISPRVVETLIQRISLVESQEVGQPMERVRIGSEEGTAEEETA